MDPAVAALDIAKAGAILANMIESYLAGGAPPSNPEGADHDDLQDCRSTSVAPSLHLHSSVDDGAGPASCHRMSGASSFLGTIQVISPGINFSPTANGWRGTGPIAKSSRDQPERAFVCCRALPSDGRTREHFRDPCQ